MKSVLLERQKNIIEFLIKNNTYVQGTIIASLLNVTSRTIRNDVKSINDCIDDKLIIANQNGYKINCDLLPVLNAKTTYIDSRQLHQQLLKELLLRNGNINIDELADALYISTSTLNQQIKEISGQFELNNLAVEKNNGIIIIKGSELNKRKMINKLIFSDVNSAFFSLESCANFFDNIDIFLVKNIVRRSLEKYSLYANDVYSTNLFINISITLSRIINGFNIDKIPVKNYDNTDSVEYKAALSIIREFKKIYQKKVNENDIIYISLLILGHTKRYTADSSDYDVKSLLSDKFLNEIKEILIYTFNYFMLKVDYEDFLWNFALHINFLIIRSSIGNSVANSLLENIKTNCPFVYDVAVYLSNCIEEKYSITVTDYEIGFIALHMGVAIETSNKKNIDNKIKAILVCNDYTNLSNKISNKIKQKYSDAIDLINVIPNLPADNYNSNSILYISTLPNTTLINNMVTISPFLSNNDFMKLDSAIDMYVKEKKKSLAKQLLLTCFREELFFHNLKFNDKYEIIKFLGDKTTEFGITEKSFSSSVVKREQLSSTCFFNSFAVPHAIELNAYQTTFSVLTSEDYFNWDENNIKVVFLIAVSKQDRKEFVNIYQSIVDILCDYKCISQVSQAKTYIEFINCINGLL